MIIKTIEKSNNPSVVYKKCLIQYGGSLSFFRESFHKPLKQLKINEPSWWPKFIQFAFDCYHEIYEKFRHIPFVARSTEFPEPFIFYNKEIVDFLRKRIIDNECNWNIVNQLVKTIEIHSIDSIWELIENNKNQHKPIEILMAASAWCRLNGKMDIWEGFKNKYGNVIKKIL